MKVQHGSKLGSSSILIIGATGFIGKYLVSYLQGKGHEIIAGVRNIQKARQQLGTDVNLLNIEGSQYEILNVLEQVDVVINMAGRPLAGVRWTKKKKREFEESRVYLNDNLCMWISRCRKPPDTFITASAVGVYGTSGATEITESGPEGIDYLADLCKRWEKSAVKTRDFGVRVVCLRMGVVLGREGGILNQLALPFEMGIGSYIGNGKQIVPWVHIEDVLRLIHHVMICKEISGPVNCTAPHSVTGKTFARTLMRFTSARVLLPLPPIILKMLFGQGECVLTNSQNVVPAKALRSGFSFKYNEVETAMHKEFANGFVRVQAIWDHYSKSSLDNENRLEDAQFRLQTESYLHVSPAKAFKFFHSPSNLGLCTPPWLNFSILEASDEIGKGSMFVYQIKIGPLPLKWKTRIVEWLPNSSFIDLQENGPYKLWVHRHQMNQLGPALTQMIDEVHYSLPFGPIGRLAHSIAIKKILKRIFSYRNEIIRFRFGEQHGGK